MQIHQVNGFNENNGQSLSNNIAQSFNVERQTRKEKEKTESSFFELFERPC
jgi:hypothetical protein